MMTTPTSTKLLATIAVALLLSFACQPAHAFVLLRQHQSTVVKGESRATIIHGKRLKRRKIHFLTPPVTTTRPSSSALAMYNLPPNRNNNNNGIGELLLGVLTILGIIAFFASPLGALVFAFFNSLLVLSFTIPLLLFVGFQAWQYFNTTVGACPSCGSTVRVLKDGNPTLCFTCGAIVKSDSQNKNKIVLCNDSDILMDEIDGAPFGWGGWNSRTTTIIEEKTKKSPATRRAERTIIDVDVEQDNDY